MDDICVQEWLQCRIYALQAAFGVAVQQALDLGTDQIERRLEHLASLVRKGLAVVPGVTVRDHGRRLCAICSFTKVCHGSGSLVARWRNPVRVQIDTPELTRSPNSGLVLILNSDLNPVASLTSTRLFGLELVSCFILWVSPLCNALRFGCGTSPGAESWTGLTTTSSNALLLTEYIVKFGIRKRGSDDAVSWISMPTAAARTFTSRLPLAMLRGRSTA